MSSQANRQERKDQPRANLDGNTSRHSYNVKPAPITGTGNSAPGKHRRGAQG